MPCQALSEMTFKLLAGLGIITRYPSKFETACHRLRTPPSPRKSDS